MKAFRPQRRRVGAAAAVLAAVGLLLAMWITPAAALDEFPPNPDGHASPFCRAPDHTEAGLGVSVSNVGGLSGAHFYITVYANGSVYAQWEINIGPNGFWSDESVALADDVVYTVAFDASPYYYEEFVVSNHCAAPTGSISVECMDGVPAVTYAYDTTGSAPRKIWFRDGVNPGILHESQTGTGSGVVTEPEGQDVQAELTWVNPLDIEIPFASLDFNTNCPEPTASTTFECRDDGPVVIATLTDDEHEELTYQLVDSNGGDDLVPVPTQGGDVEVEYALDEDEDFSLEVLYEGATVAAYSGTPDCDQRGPTDDPADPADPVDPPVPAEPTAEVLTNATEITPASLPVTGRHSGELAAAAVLLIGLGSLAMIAGRRGRAQL